MQAIHRVCVLTLIALLVATQLWSISAIEITNLKSEDAASIHKSSRVSIPILLFFSN